MQVPDPLKMNILMTDPKKQFNPMIICILKYSVWMKKPIIFSMKEVIMLKTNCSVMPLTIREISACPLSGKLMLKNLTINEAREKVEKSLGVYLNNISVIVRFVSNKVTVLGEVANPGQHSFYDEKVTVFQALGFAGGSSAYGDLSNVTLVREKDNVIKYYYLDLTKKNIASSEYYYLLPNDVLIINPIKAKYRDLRDYALDLTATVLTSISAVLSIILITRTL